MTRKSFIVVSHPRSGGNRFCSSHRVIMYRGLCASANLHSPTRKALTLSNRLYAWKKSVNIM